jgi:hypothetical protein
VKPETVPSWHRLRVPIGRQVGTGEAATATRFTSNLDLENRLYDQKGIQAKPARSGPTVLSRTDAKCRELMEVDEVAVNCLSDRVLVFGEAYLC